MPTAVIAITFASIGTKGASVNFTLPADYANDGTTTVEVVGAGARGTNGGATFGGAGSNGGSYAKEVNVSLGTPGQTITVQLGDHTLGSAGGAPTDTWIKDASGTVKALARGGGSATAMVGSTTFAGGAGAARSGSGGGGGGGAAGPSAGGAAGAVSSTGGAGGKANGATGAGGAGGGGAGSTAATLWTTTATTAGAIASGTNLGVGTGGGGGLGDGSNGGVGGDYGGGGGGGGSNMLAGDGGRALIVITYTALATRTADLSQTLGAVGLAATGTVPDGAALNKTLGPVALSADSAVVTHAAAAITLGGVTLAAAGVVARSADAAITLGPLTLAAAGVVKTGGALSVTLGAVGLAAASSATVRADLAKTLGAVTLAAAATHAVNGALAVTLGPITLVSANHGVSTAFVAVEGVRTGVGWPSWAAEAVHTPAVGTWDAGYPLQNLSDLVATSKVARASSPAQKEFSSVLPQGRPVQFFALVGHNVTNPAAAFRIIAFSDANPDPAGNTAAIVADTGAQLFWPAGSAPVSGYRSVRPVLLTAPVTARSFYVAIAAVDVAPELEGFEIASWWEWPGIGYGFTTGVDPSGQTKALLGGGAAPSDGWAPRVLSGEIPYLNLGTAATTALDFQRGADLDRPFVFVDDVYAAARWARCCVLVRNDRVAALTGAAYRHDRFAFEFREHRK